MSQKWDLRFLELAKLASTWSKDPSTKTGAVIVRPDKTVASIGFNGFPAQFDDSEADYLNREVKYSKIVHCEMNALLHARQTVEGFTLYTHPFACCSDCVKHMISAGITRFVYPVATDDLLSRWGKSFEKTKSFLHEAKGIIFDEYDGNVLQRNVLTTEIPPCPQNYIYRIAKIVKHDGPDYLKSVCKLRKGHKEDHDFETFDGSIAFNAVSNYDIIWTKREKK